MNLTGYAGMTLILIRDWQCYPIPKTERHVTHPFQALLSTNSKKNREVGNGLLFPSSLDQNQAFDYRKQWLKCLKAAKIENFRWHDLRHDTASTLARDGRTLKEIAEILGHKSLASTDRYTHLSTAHKSQVLNDTMAKSIFL